MELTWELRPFFRVAGYSIRYYSLIFIVVFLGGWAWFRWQIVRGGGDEHEADYFLPLSAVAIWVFGRLAHFIFYAWDEVVADPFVLVDVSRGGIASHGSAVGLLIAMWIFTQWRGVSFVEGCDRFAFTAAWGAALVRIGNFFNSEVVGRLTDQSWGVRFLRHDIGVENVPLRHPSQFYEFAMALGVLALLAWVDRRAGAEKRPRGLMISTFLVAYFTGRFVVEFWKEYQSLDPSAILTMGQWLSMPGIALGLAGLYLSLTERTPVGWNSGAPTD